jgi:hypothetical protein
LRRPRDFARMARAVDIATQADVPPDDGSPSFSADTLRMMDWSIRSIHVFSHDRETVSRSLDNRCEQMIRAGLLAEVSRLLAQGLSSTHASSRAIGYRQSIAFLDILTGLGRDASCRRVDVIRAFGDYLDDFRGATRRLGRKQMIWFRSEKQLHQWLPAPTVDDGPRRVVDSTALVGDIARLTAMEHDQFWDMVASPEWRSLQDHRREPLNATVERRSYMAHPTTISIDELVQLLQQAAVHRADLLPAITLLSQPPRSRVRRHVLRSALRENSVSQPGVHA